MSLHIATLVASAIAGLSAVHDLQEVVPSRLAAGAAAPPLRLGEFLRGPALERFEPGHIYALEFWATWCGPCIGAMPHLSELQARYAERGVTILGVDVWEDKGPVTATTEAVRAFVAKRGSALTYPVALDADGAMARTWLDAAGVTGIPSTFVVDRAGKLAWIGHPDALELVLDELLASTWHVVEGPARIAKAREEVEAACNQYAVSLEAGDAAWKVVSARYPSYAPRFLDRRYAEMVINGHSAAGYALGRELLAEARAKRDSILAMDVVTPMMDAKRNEKAIDRELALAVAALVFELGDPADPGRHISLVQIHYFLGDLAEARKHRELAVQLSPPGIHDRMNEWFDRLEADAVAGDK